MPYVQCALTLFSSLFPFFFFLFFYSLFRFFSLLYFTFIPELPLPSLVYHNLVHASLITTSFRSPRCCDVQRRRRAIDQFLISCLATVQATPALLASLQIPPTTTTTLPPLPSSQIRPVVAATAPSRLAALIVNRETAAQSASAAISDATSAVQNARIAPLPREPAPIPTLHQLPRPPPTKTERERPINITTSGKRTSRQLLVDIISTTQRHGHPRRQMQLPETISTATYNIASSTTHPSLITIINTPSRIRPRLIPQTRLESPR